MYKICTVLSQLSVCRLGLRAYPFTVDNASRLFIVVKCSWVLYSLSVVLKEFDRPIRSDSTGNSTTVHFFSLQVLIIALCDGCAL